MLPRELEVLKVFSHCADMTLEAASAGSAGLDLRSACSISIEPGQYRRVPTPFVIELPPSYVGLVCPRSGLADRHGITVLNSPGIIDSDYRGVISVLLVNLGTQVFHIESGDRIAQLVVVKQGGLHILQVPRIEDLSSTGRGVGGFGSTGVS